jgi:hypothetical protein
VDGPGRPKRTVLGTTVVPTTVVVVVAGGVLEAEPACGPPHPLASNPRHRTAQDETASRATTSEASKGGALPRSAPQRHGEASLA